jgi:hypothetical protein
VIVGCNLNYDWSTVSIVLLDLEVIVAHGAEITIKVNRLRVMSRSLCALCSPCDGILVVLLLNFRLGPVLFISIKSIFLETSDLFSTIDREADTCFKTVVRL